MTKEIRLSIQDLIATAGDRLTPTDRRIAEAVMENPTLLAFGTVSDLADHVGTSRPSIVRFATKLGFEGYSDLQAQERDQVSQSAFETEPPNPAASGGGTASTLGARGDR